MHTTWTDQLVEQLGWQWDNHFRPRLDDLTDEEYLWEPVPACWSLRHRGDAVGAMSAGAGDTVADYEYPEPEPAPVTTIAWRMGHISIGVFGERAANHFGDGGVSYGATDWPLTATGGLALLDRWYRSWMAGVKSLDDDGLARPCGPHEGPFADHPFSALVLHINREALHHAAEIALLRDLYGHHPSTDSAGENQ
ncbi:MAG: DinB family protein [Actinomycetota bacterium]|nr:DinB family protein [Actinomycetota bacterium]